MPYGAVTTNAPTYTTDQFAPLSLTTSGELRVSTSGGSLATESTLSTISGRLTPNNILSYRSNGANASGVIKNSAGRLYSLYCLNLNPMIRYLMLFNNATGSGLTTPLEVYPVYGNNGALFLDSKFFSDAGLEFTTGITFGYSSDPTTYTAATASECILVARYS